MKKPIVWNAVNSSLVKAAALVKKPNPCRMIATDSFKKR